MTPLPGKSLREALARIWPDRWTSPGYNERLGAPRIERAGVPRTAGTRRSWRLAIGPRWLTRRGHTGPVGPQGWPEQSYNERLEASERDVR